MYNLERELSTLRQLGVTVKVYSGEHYWDIPNDLRPREYKANLIKVLEGIQPFTPEDDGFLLRQNEATSFHIVVEMPVSKQLMAATVSGSNKQLSPLANRSANGNYVALKTVPTYPVMDGFSTLPNDNGLRLISTIGNILRVFEIVVASRAYREEGSLHFLTVQELYHGQLFLRNGLATVPAEEFRGFNNWIALKNTVQKMVNKDELPESVTPANDELPEVTEDGKATVLFFNPCTGLGRAVLKGRKTAGLHWKELDIAERFPFVGRGQQVSFKITSTGDRGNLKLHGVKPL